MNLEEQILANEKALKEKRQALIDSRLKIIKGLEEPPILWRRSEIMKWVLIVGVSAWMGYCFGWKIASGIMASMVYWRLLDG